MFGKLGTSFNFRVVLWAYKVAKKRRIFLCHIHFKRMELQTSSSVGIPSLLAALQFIFIVHKYCPPVINTISDCKFTERAVQGGGGRLL